MPQCSLPYASLSGLWHYPYGINVAVKKNTEKTGNAKAGGMEAPAAVAISPHKKSIGRQSTNDTLPCKKQASTFQILPAKYITCITSQDVTLSAQPHSEAVPSPSHQAALPPTRMTQTDSRSGFRNTLFTAGLTEKNLSTSTTLHWQRRNSVSPTLNTGTVPSWANTLIRLMSESSSNAPPAKA